MACRRLPKLAQQRGHIAGGCRWVSLATPVMEFADGQEAHTARMCPVGDQKNVFREVPSSSTSDASPSMAALLL